MIGMIQKEIIKWNLEFILVTIYNLEKLKDGIKYINCPIGASGRKSGKYEGL